MDRRSYSRHPISKSVDLISADCVKLGRGKVGPQLVTDTPRPLAVVLAWMMASPKHLAKYTDIYLKRGYDVLTVNCTPWQLLWPVKGSQVIAEDVVNFLDENKSCWPIVVHGFSVGGYVWGEVMVRLKEDLCRYQPIIDRIVGQTWDSAADFTEFQVGLPLAVFPTNPILRRLLERYVR
ncbi:transmembrane protein 53 isoform X2 [Nilaparvata lugens]|nr:transmembrane protein 53 isoform X2 [Nilaparvata lugens]